jgi:hypothetical protein
VGTYPVAVVLQYTIQYNTIRYNTVLYNTQKTTRNNTYTLKTIYNTNIANQSEDSLISEIEFYIFICEFLLFILKSRVSKYFVAVLRNTLGLFW